MSHCQRLISHSMKHCKQPHHFPISHPAAASSGIVIVISVALLPSSNPKCVHVLYMFVHFVCSPYFNVHRNRSTSTIPLCQQTLDAHSSCLSFQLFNCSLLKNQHDDIFYPSFKFHNVVNLSVISTIKSTFVLSAARHWQTYQSLRRNIIHSNRFPTRSRRSTLQNQRHGVLWRQPLFFPLPPNLVVPSLHLINGDLFYFVILIIFLAYSCQFFPPRLSILRFDLSSSTLTEEIPEFTQRSFHILHTLNCCQSLEFSFVF